MSRRYIIRELRDVWESFVAADRQYLRSPKLCYVFLAPVVILFIFMLFSLNDWAILFTSEPWLTLVFQSLPFIFVAWAWYLSRSNLVRFLAVSTVISGEIAAGLMLADHLYGVKSQSISGSFLALMSCLFLYYGSALVGLCSAFQDRYWLAKQSPR